jgi:HSP20 family protein
MVEGGTSVVNLRVRKPDVPARRPIWDWPSVFDWDRDFLNPMFGLTMPTESMAELTWVPKVDIIEKPDSWIFKAELPEVKAEDINVTIEEGTLSIRGERKFEEEVKEGNFTRFERQYGSFERRFSLPAGIDESSVKADYKNGVLTLTIRKKEEAKPKSVKINVS